MSDIVPNETLSWIIGLVYDAAIEPRRWPEALDAIRASLSFENSSFNLQDIPSGDILLNITTNISKPYLDRMTDYGADALNLWGGLRAVLSLSFEEPSVLSSINPTAVQYELTGNRYALEWAQPQGLIDVMALPLARDERVLGSVAFGRHERAGPIGEREIASARLLHPHLQRAAKIASLLDLERVARSSFEAAIDSLAAPVMLVGEDLKLVHANPAAQEILMSGLYLKVKDGLLIGGSTGVTAALARAVTQAKHGEEGLGDMGLGIPVRSSDGGVGALYIMPFGRRRGGLKSVTAAVFLTRLGVGSAAPVEIIAKLFGLTPAEAKVLGHIGEGRTVQEIGKAFSIGRSTVRTHLIKLFEKTGARRQAELVRLTHALTPPWAKL